LDRNPAVLYSLLFICTFEIAEMFESPRRIIFLAADAVRKHPRWEVEQAAVPLILSVVLCIVVVLAWWKHHSKVALGGIPALHPAGVSDETHQPGQ
jgi:hypothetical protein